MKTRNYRLQLKKEKKKHTLKTGFRKLKRGSKWPKKLNV